MMYSTINGAILRPLMIIYHYHTKKIQGVVNAAHMTLLYLLGAFEILWTIFCRWPPVYPQVHSP